MASNMGKVKQFDEKRPNLVEDYDEMYRELKVRYADFINAGKVGFDDRTKLFHFAFAEGWHEWMLLSYNQNRMSIGIAFGCAPGGFGYAPSGGHSFGGSYPSYPDQNNLSWQLSSIQTSLSQLTQKLCALEGRISCLESKQPPYRPSC